MKNWKYRKIETVPSSLQLVAIHKILTLSPKAEIIKKLDKGKNHINYAK
jgi:hypothetical protein